MSGLVSGVATCCSQLLRLAINEIVGDDDVSVVVVVVFLRYRSVAEFHLSLEHRSAHPDPASVLSVLVVARTLDDSTDEAETLSLLRHGHAHDTAPAHVIQLEERGVSLLHVNVHRAETGDGGVNLLARHLESGDDDVALDRSEKALLGESLEILGRTPVDRVELVVDGVVVERVADRELVALGEEQSTEWRVGVEEIEGHVEGCASIPVDHTEAVFERTDLRAIGFATEQMLELVHGRAEMVRVVASIDYNFDVVLGAVLCAGNGEEGEEGCGSGEGLHSWCRCGWVMLKMYAVRSVL